MSIAGIRYDPYGAFNFKVEIKSIIIGGFSEVSGLGVQIEYETLKEGGVNDYEHKLLKGVKYTDITLKRGITDWALWNWYQKVADGTIEKQDASIHLCNNSGMSFMTWDIYEVYPVKWDGPTFNASTNTIATETLVLTHHGIRKRSEAEPVLVRILENLGV